MFDFTRKDGARWVEFVTEKLHDHVLPRLEAWAEKEIRVHSIQNFKDNLQRNVASERQLVRYVSQREGVQKGLERLYAYYLFNISGKTEYAELAHCRRFISELGKTFKQQQKTD